MGNYVPGTEGYALAVRKFIEATMAIDFVELHRDFLPFIPKKSARVLDVGAGIGRDAAVLAGWGHTVLAVEPTEEFRIEGKEMYGSLGIEWTDDSLPELEQLKDRTGDFDFILASAVWHHLDAKSQYRALERIAQLLDINGLFALTLRNGPAGIGTHVHPTDGRQVISDANQYGLAPILFLENQPSLIKNKEKVTWTKLVFQK